MKPFMLVEGSSQAIETFEQKIAKALEMGYILAGEILAHPQAQELKLYQPMMFSEEETEDWDEDEEEEDEDE